MKSRVSQMNLIPRHQEILDLAKQKGYLSTEELTAIFKVTSQTIRRDINELCNKGLLRRYPIKCVRVLELAPRLLLSAGWFLAHSSILPGTGRQISLAFEFLHP